MWIQCGENMASFRLDKQKLKTLHFREGERELRDRGTEQERRRKWLGTLAKR